jgi:DNA-binding NarL/FixJ family response regulator
MNAPKTNVFIVSEHELARDCLATLIAKEGDLTICGSGKTLESVTEAVNGRRPDVVLLNEPSLASLTREIDYGAYPPIIAIIKDEIIREAANVLRAGAAGCITSRDSVADLVRAIRAVDTGETSVSKPIADIITRQLIRRRGGGHWGRPITTELSDRESEIFRMLGEGKSTTEIARILGLSPKTVQAYSGRIKLKRGHRSLHETICDAIQSQE